MVKIVIIFFNLKEWVDATSEENGLKSDAFI